MIFEERKDNYLLSADKTKLDFNLIRDFLCNGNCMEIQHPGIYLSNQKKRK